jgi:hypothetical protein
MGKQVKEHHWTAGIKPNNKKYFGFIYEIYNIIDGKHYIGCKQFYKYKKQGRTITYKITGESDWRSYMGSNVALKNDIKRYGKDHFTFKILKHTPNRGMHRYLETEMIVKRGAILPKNKDKYYNGQLSAIKYRLTNDLVNGLKKEK